MYGNGEDNARENHPQVIKSIEKIYNEAQGKYTS